MQDKAERPPSGWPSRRGRLRAELADGGLHRPGASGVPSNAGARAGAGAGVPSGAGAGAGGEYRETERSSLIALGPAELAAAIEWP